VRETFAALAHRHDRGLLWSRTACSVAVRRWRHPRHTVIYTKTIDSLKRFQDDRGDEVQEGFECGSTFRTSTTSRSATRSRLSRRGEVERTSLDEPPSAA